MGSTTALFTSDDQLISFNNRKKSNFNVNSIEDNLIPTKGLTLVSGCGHAGIVNTLEHASNIFNDTSNVYAAVGGFHLFNKTEKDISWTAKHMRKHGIQYFLGAHFTGIDAVYQIRKNNGMKREDCSVAAIGSYFDIVKGMYAGRITN